MDNHNRTIPYRTVFICGFMLLFCLGNLGAVGDARFFGTWCGEATYSTEHRTYRIADVKIHLKYVLSATGEGLIHGRGSVPYEGRRVPFVVAAHVTGRGVMWGHVRLPGYPVYRGSASLTADGMTLRVHAFGMEAVLQKTACGNRPPRVSVQSPGEGSAHDYGEVVELRGKIVWDETPEDFPRHRLTWASNRIPGVLATGMSVHLNDLPPGPHTIRFSATDSGGLSASDTVRIVITNHDPEAPEIIAPENGAEVAGCGSVVFRGRARDAEDGFMAGENLHWTSDRDGSLGTGGRLVLPEPLSEGRHTITLTARDRGGATSSTSISLTVVAEDANCPPAVYIIDPQDLSGGYASGETYHFNGRARDNEDGPLPGSSRLRWYYQMGDGDRRLIGTGVGVDWTVPPVDSDTRVVIIFQAEDSHGSTAEDRVEIYVSPVPLI